MEILALSQRILIKAAQQLGGVAALARFLEVGDATLGEWLSGRQVPSAVVILKATSLLIHDAAQPGHDGLAPDRLQVVARQAMK